MLRLEGLPLRPVTARTFVGSLSDEPDDGDRDDVAPSRPDSAWELDPGWNLAEAGNRRGLDKLSLIAERSWWPPGVASGPASELLTRLWRHSVAVGIAAPRLAREAGDPDPEAVARAGRSARWDAGRSRRLIRNGWSPGGGRMTRPFASGWSGPNWARISATWAAGWPSDGAATRWWSTRRGSTPTRTAPQSRRVVHRSLGGDPGGLSMGRTDPLGAAPPGPRAGVARAPAADPDGGGAGTLRRPIRGPVGHAARGAGDATERPAAAPGRPAAGCPGPRRAFPRAASRLAPGRDARGVGRPRGHDLVRGARRRGRAITWQGPEGPGTATCAAESPPGTESSAPPGTRIRRALWSRSMPTAPRGRGRALVRGRGAGRGPG